jgi:hypothetical protein
MAGSVVQGDKSGNILVEFDYNNIIVVDPNKTIDAFGNIKERIVDHENIVMYANLEAEVIPRTKLALGITPSNDNTRTISVAKMNFLRPTEGTSLTTGYYDELTGKNAKNMLGQNQIKNELIEPKGDTPYQKTYIASPGEKATDNGLLGITSIQVRTNTSFTPSVSMVLEDIQGRALFQLGDNSPYAAFFNLPYPPFYLTLKGYYGQAIRYQLNLKTFNASFNSYSGNYTIKLEFVGFKFNILNEISVGSLLAAPHMYSNRFNVSQSPTSPEPANKNISASASQTNAISKASTISSDNIVTELVTEKGYQKIIEVYSEYKAKGLLPENFPELTLAQLINKLEMFEQNILNSYNKVNVESLTNIRTYKEVLNAYFTQVRDTWFNLYLNPKPIVTTKGENIYTFKDSYADVTSQTAAVAQLKKYITEFNNLLSVNKTLGARGTTPIKNPITYDMFVTNFVPANIDWTKTTIERTGIKNPTLLDVLAQTTSLQKTQKPYADNIQLTSSLPTNIDIVYPPVFVFDGKNGFNNTINQMNTEASQKLSAQETKLSAELAKKIEDKATGIGFKPSVRNMCAVIMANAEGFIRLLDDVHTTAWNVKYDPVRRGAILNNLSSAPGTDTRDNFNVTTSTSNENQGLSTAQIPVYPWPQFFVESPDDKKGRFQLKYIGDPSVVDLTKGFLYDKWPEVQFVEEYMKGLTQKFNPPIAQLAPDTESTTKIININAIEYPSSGIAYANKEEIKFFYEIWERQFLTTHYSGFIRANQNQIGELIKLNNEVETNNLVNSIGISSPYISLKLKNYDLTSSNYKTFLENISNQGTGKSYQEYIRDFFVTPYIKTLTESSFNILSIFDLGKNPETSPVSPGLKQLVANASNTPLLIDTYPFTNPKWVGNNMSSAVNSSGDSVYNTTRVLKVYEPRNVISNFTSINDTSTNRPVTNFSYLLSINPFPDAKIGLVNFYSNRKINYQNADSLLVATEGYVNYISPNNTVPTQTTTTILNTPYFINAIQNGVYSWRKQDKYPYIQAAYLFINSLPLANLKERYKTKGETRELDYIASCFKKFGAIHKMPYAWVLKLGSVWYRYKTYKQSNIDILDSAWTYFDYKTNFDPITSATTKTYNFEFDGVKKAITLQDDSKGFINIQTGFYPKVINDFNVFYTGYDLYTKYTDSEIQNSINGGMKIFDFDKSNIATTQNNKPLILSTWSVILPDNVIDNDEVNCNPKQNTTSYDYFIVPSFGNELNQTKISCFKNDNLVVSLTDNQSMYNGSVRLLWDAPNYGYFDNSQIVKPEPNSYMNKILTDTNYQAPFNLLNVDEYSKIDEIFSVFDKSILDQFEQEFLNFCKPIADIDLGPQVAVPLDTSPVDTNAIFRNFQYLFKTLMSVTGMKTNQTTESYFLTIGNTQLTSFESNIKAFLEYDVILKYGNPANYKRRTFDSFTSYKSTTQSVVDPINFDPYVLNSLPSSKGGITLSQSRTQYPLEWATLETEVGFSTIDNLIYTNFGSYITDFFIDNDIKFSVNNIVICAPLIKMYATQKLFTPTITSDSFKTKIQDYLQTETGLQNIFLNDLLNSVRNALPNQQQLPEKTIQSVIDGQQSKVENYEVFKALNDKWIAGSDFKNKTLFEDFLFLDRASRNIGDTIILDIFEIKRMLSTNALNMEMSVFTLLSGMLIQNKFNVMPLPAYVNFYNVQEVDGTTISQNTEGSLQFADNMWGTFLDVDYRKSSPKILCFYTGLPSAYLDLPKNNSKYRSDGFEMRRASENPLIENQQNKKDWAVSNRCVGFNVDVGIRNQNIFYSFSVSMDSGKATSESIQTQLNMINQESGRTVATQNISLYNLYKQRSYQCQVSCLGNALLQPMMYFNLRHVPMFNGPYMILDVSHTINAGSFITSFTGIRQGIYDLPAIDNYLQSINQNLLTKIEALLKIKKDDVTAKAITEIGKAAQVVQSGNNTKAAPNACVNNLVVPYLTWANTEVATQTSLTPKEFADVLKIKLANNPTLQILIFLISYVRTFQKDTFVGYNHNYGTIELTTNYAESSGNFIAGRCSCVNIPDSKGTKTAQPVANFASVDKYIDFMVSRLEQNVPRITNGVDGIGITKYYVCHWPKDNVSESDYDSHLSQYAELDKTFQKGFKLAGGFAGLNVEATNVIKNEDKEIRKILKQTLAGITKDINNLNTTTTAIPACPPPTVTSFSPMTGVTGTILSIRGANLDTTTGVTINSIVVTTGITIYNPTNISVIVPYSYTSETIVEQNKPIIVSTQNGVGSSTTNFTYNPNQTTPAPPTVAPGVPANANTNPQQTGPIVLLEKTQYDLLGSNTKMDVTINPEAGSWDIIPQYTEWTWKAINVVPGPNNTTVEEVIGKGQGRGLEEYVYTNKKQFEITNLDILQNVKESIDDDVEFKKIDIIYNKISLMAVSSIKYDKFRITNNPNDVIPDAYQTFSFYITFR